MQNKYNTTLNWYERICHNSKTTLFNTNERATVLHVDQCNEIRHFQYNRWG